MKEWYISRQSDELEGPFSEDELRKRHAQGQLKLDTLVWNESMPDWLPAGEVLRETKWSLPKIEQLAKAAAAQQPPPRSYTSYWVIAGVALVGALAYSLLSRPSFPVLNDVSAQDAKSLKTATHTVGQPIAAIAMSLNDLSSPQFHIATNLPDGERIDVLLRGLQETLVDVMPMPIKTSLIVKKGLALSPSFRQENGLPLPRGEYILSVNQGPKVLAQQTFFVGGVRDQAYEESLRHFHERMKAQAGELLALKQVTELVARDLSEVSEAVKKPRAPKTRLAKRWTVARDQIKVEMLRSSGYYKEISSPLRAEVDLLNSIHHSLVVRPTRVPTELGAAKANLRPILARLAVAERMPSR